MVILNKVIGVYGVSGSGKSHSFSQMQKERFEWRYVEGSQVLREIAKESGLGELDTLSSEVKEGLRLKAIKRIRGMQGITCVSGHASFPTLSVSPFGELSFQDVFTEGDGQTYDAIFYLDKAAEVVHRQRTKDNNRKRTDLSVQQLAAWINHEKELLSKECARYGIPLHIVNNGMLSLVPSELEETMQSKGPAPRMIELPDSNLCQAIEVHAVCGWYAEAYARSTSALKEVVATIPKADLYLLIDGDRTLCPQDTGRMFFEDQVRGDVLKEVFKRRSEYNFGAFADVSFLYATTCNTKEYMRLSNEIGSNLVNVYEAWKMFLTDLPSNICPILLSCSNREIWEAVVTQHDLGMHIIAGNHAGLHSYLIDQEAKGTVVQELRRLNVGCKVFAFGDSLLDLDMLQESDRSYVVVDENKHNRSLQDAIKNPPAHWRQLTNLYTPCPTFWHTGMEVDSLSRLKGELLSCDFNAVVHFSGSASARVLATQTRRADLMGAALQDIHRNVGRYLASRAIDIIRDLSIDQDNHPHVQGHTFCGPVACSNVIIMPLMRGGEPMSRGVYEVFREAQLVHHNHDTDLSTVNFCQGQTLILVDSVVNTGRSLCAILDKVPDYVHVVCIVGVIQRHACEFLTKQYLRVRFVSLRVSDNQYTGSGSTDTGNRLFQTF